MMRNLSFTILLLFNQVALALSAENASPVGHGELMRVVTGLFCVLLIIVCLSWLLKRLNVVKLSTSNGFQSIATMTFGPKEKMMLTKVGERYLLIGIGAGAINLIYDFGEERPKGFESDNKPAFAELLKSAVRKS